MRLYASTLAPCAAAKDVSAAARALLAYAVREHWGIALPEIIVLPGGKPCFAGTQGKYFSISHSKAHILVGISRHDIGVDIEEHRALRPGLFERLFSPEMRSCFSFWEGWCAREAIFKLTGRGSIMTMELRRKGDLVTGPYEGAVCRFYDSIPGCTVAAASAEDEFCGDITIVPASDFLP